MSVLTTGSAAPPPNAKHCRKPQHLLMLAPVSDNTGPCIKRKSTRKKTAAVTRGVAWLEPRAITLCRIKRNAEERGS